MCSCCLREFVARLDILEDDNWLARSKASTFSWILTSSLGQAQLDRMKKRRVMRLFCQYFSVRSFRCTRDGRSRNQFRRFALSLRTRRCNTYHQLVGHNHTRDSYRFPSRLPWDPPERSICFWALRLTHSTRNHGSRSIPSVPVNLCTLKGSPICSDLRATGS